MCGVNDVTREGMSEASLTIRPYQFNNLVLGIALSDIFENVKKI